MTTALYIRLSEADGDKPESDSVKGQRDLLTDFVSTHPELSGSKVLTFIDDDYTGLNLNRPALQSMLEQTKRGEINCIIVKDFSRFSRSSVDSSEYLELIFPFLNVRFISVTNHYDSNSHKGATAGFEAAVPALIAEMYSRDLSVKIKSAKTAKAKRGEFLGSRAPYGYVKSKTVRNGLEIDPAAAEVIKRIFAMAAAGTKPAQVAKTLNIEGVDPPMTHFLKQNPKDKCYRTKSEKTCWKYENIRKYLRDETYTGKLISGTKDHYELGSGKSKTVSRENWIVVNNAIPAIITEDEFIKAQGVIKDVKNAPSRKESIFAHKVICGHCGYSLKRQALGTYGCISHRYTEQKKCLDGIVREEWLKNKVLEAYIDAVGSQTLLSQQEQRYEADTDAMKAQLKQQRQSAQRLKDTKKALFERFTSGTIDTADYKIKNAELTRQLNDVELDINHLETAIEQAKHKPQAQVQTTAALTEFSDDMMACVKSIKVFSTSQAIVEIDLSIKKYSALQYREV